MVDAQGSKHGSSPATVANQVAILALATSEAGGCRFFGRPRPATDRHPPRALPRNGDRGASFPSRGAIVRPGAILWATGHRRAAARAALKLSVRRTTPAPWWRRGTSGTRWYGRSADRSSWRDSAGFLRHCWRYRWQHPRHYPISRASDPDTDLYPSRERYPGKTGVVCARC